MWGGGASSPTSNKAGSGSGKAAVDEMLTIEPDRCSHMVGITAFDAWMIPMKLTARKSSQVAVNWSNMRPALFTRQSTPPSVSITD